MILIDTSAWVEFLRDTGSVVCDRVDSILDDEIATCHPVRMEVLAGAGDERHLQNLRRLLARATLIPTEPSDYEDAAAMYRGCRRQGETVRKLMDCLISATAIRASLSVLQSDRDFEVLARHTALSLDDGRSGN
jgi:predicted nucleic acid-binding protein